MREGQINIDQIKAVAAAFIEIKTPRFCKKVQVDPYLEVSFILKSSKIDKIDLSYF